MVLELDEGAPVLEEDSIIPDTQGIAAVPVTVNIVAYSDVNSFTALWCLLSTSFLLRV